MSMRQKSSAKKALTLPRDRALTTTSLAILNREANHTDGGRWSSLPEATTVSLLPCPAAEGEPLKYSGSLDAHSHASLRPVEDEGQWRLRLLGTSMLV